MKHAILITLFLLPATAGAAALEHNFRHLHLITEFSYGGAFVDMQKVNYYYLDRFAIPVGMFDSRYHWCHFFSPEIGLIVKRNIISIGYQQYYGIMQGPTYLTPESKSVQLNLYTLFSSLGITYRHLVMSRRITGAFGGGLSAGNGFFAIDPKRSIIYPPVDMYAFGGGASIFGDVYHVFKGHLLLGLRISGNLIMTNPLKYAEDDRTWHLEGRPMNLNYSGVSVMVRIGSLQ